MATLATAIKRRRGFKPPRSIDNAAAIKTLSPGDDESRSTSHDIKEPPAKKRKLMAKKAKSQKPIVRNVHKMQRSRKYAKTAKPIDETSDSELDEEEDEQESQMMAESKSELEMFSVEYEPECAKSSHKNTNNNTSTIATTTTTTTTTTALAVPVRDDDDDFLSELKMKKITDVDVDEKEQEEEEEEKHAAAVEQKTHVDVAEKVPRTAASDKQERSETDEDIDMQQQQTIATGYERIEDYIENTREDSASTTTTTTTERKTRGGRSRLRSECCQRLLIGPLCTASATAKWCIEWKEHFVSQSERAEMKKVFVAAFSTSSAQAQDLLDGNLKYVLMKNERQKTVAFLSYLQLKMKFVVVLKTLAVKPKYQRCGLGSMLVLAMQWHMLRHASAFAMYKLYAEVALDDEAILQFWNHDELAMQAITQHQYFLSSKKARDNQNICEYIWNKSERQTEYALLKWLRKYRETFPKAQKQKQKNKTDKKKDKNKNKKKKKNKKHNE